MKPYMVKRWVSGLSHDPDFSSQYQIINANDWYEANALAGVLIRAYQKSHGLEYLYMVTEIKD